MNAQKFSAKAHTRTDYNYSHFHKSLLHENNGEDYALRHIYSLENTKELLKKWEWTDEQIKQGIDFATIDVYQNFVYLHIPNKIIKEYKTPDPHSTIKKIRGISRFISKLDYVDILIKRCWMKADPYKLEPGSEWDEFIAKGNTGDFYELKLMAYHISCTCHAYRGIEKAFLQDIKAQNYLINHEIAQGQIPDKHIFAVWKYLGADNYTQYQYCWIERRDKALKYYQWEFKPEDDEVLAS